MTRLHILYEHSSDQKPHGCSYVRLLRPLHYPGLDTPWQVSQGTSLPTDGADIVILERRWHPGLDTRQAMQLVRQLRRTNSRLIYTLDDDLLGLGLAPDSANAIRLLAREAERVIVSTPPLGARMARLNPHVHVLPNQIDDTLFGPPAPPKQAQADLTIGYMGTFSHLDDLLSILAPLRRVLRRHAGRVRLELVGVADAGLLQGLFEGLPVTVRQATGCVAYPDFVGWMQRELQWDFALAPLVSSPFSACKSDLKWLDYGALGIPAIFSHVTPYADSVTSGQTGLLADSAHDWEAMLEALIRDADLRLTLARQVQDHVFGQRSLRQHAGQWVKAIGVA